MANILNVAVIPLDIAWADRDENLLNVERKLNNLSPATDLVILPELFSTGFIDDLAALQPIAETLSGPTLTAIHRWAKEFNVALAGSFLFKSGGKFYNRAFFVEPSGEEIFYDKRHLFSLSCESDIFTKGMELPPVARFRGWNLALIVCYDLRFPVWCRNAGHRYDAMLVPSNWPAAREYAWKHLLIARGIENQAYYIGANRSGSDDHGSYTGTALIVDALGKPIASIDETTGILYASFDRDLLEKQRLKFPAGKDADDFTCHIIADK